MKKKLGKLIKALKGEYMFKGVDKLWQKTNINKIKIKALKMIKILKLKKYIQNIKLN